MSVRTTARALACLALALASPALSAEPPASVRLIEDKLPGERIEGEVVVPAAPAAVWEVMLDCENAPRFLPKTESCEVLERPADGASSLIERKVRFLPVLPFVTLRIRSHFTPQREIRFQQEGGDLEILEGVWRLEPLGPERTRLTYQARMKASVPSFLVRGGLVADTEANLEALRSEVLRRQAAQP